MSVVFDITTRRGQEEIREVFSRRRVSSFSPDEAEQARQAGYEPSTVDDWLIGRDPRVMTQGELRAIGHVALSPMRAIRAKCLDCCAGSSDEVRKCVAVGCQLWPFRTSKNPWRASPSEAQRESARRSIARMNAAASDAGKMSPLSEEASALVPE
jgi:hypothetical protein